MDTDSSHNGVARSKLTIAFDALLQPARFHDYGPNGLQVEGKPNVRRLVSGVTACRALIDAAIEAKADAIFVHHGLFWRGQSGVITGWMKQRIARLLAHDINLYAYHLPLDAHPKLGNNAQIGQRLGLTTKSVFGEYDLGCIGSPTNGTAFESADALTRCVEQAFGRSPLAVVGHTEGPIENIAWCSGGAQGWFEAAIDAGAQAFITGEISEPQTHLARECGVLFLACGHHATERYGAPAVAAEIASELGIEHQFIDIDNPA
jgi:dinuclear metal center YbgI/SA1388 family protein